MSDFFHKFGDRKSHYLDSNTSKIAKPFEGIVRSNWDEIYSGETNDKNQKHGYGEMSWYLDTHGIWTQTDWKNSIFQEGENTKRILKDDVIVFKGNWVNDLPEGRGELFFNNKSFIKGTWHSGVLHGKIKQVFSKFSYRFYNPFFSSLIDFYKSPDPMFEEKKYLKELEKDEHWGTFEGDVKYGLANGKGNLEFYNSSGYNGDWINGYPNGKGIRIYSDGREEFGEFGILNEGSLTSYQYTENMCGQFLHGLRKFANGQNENVDRRTLSQKAKSFIKDF